MSHHRAERMNIRIEEVAESRLSELDFSKIEFGNVFSDHLFRRNWEEGAWQEASLIPYQSIPVNPAALGLHYGQAVFEGLKAYRGTQDGIIRLFRPDRNAERLQRSCERLCIPTVPTDDFLNAIQALVSLDRDWVPASRLQTLYLRPILFGSEGHLAVRPSRTYEFWILAAPVSEYFDRAGPGISLKAEDRFTRAAPGGMGAAKTGGNYAATLRPTGDSLAGGFNQVLWLDAHEHHFIEEAGQMNIFFRLGDTVVTPPLSGTILPGVTRDCVLTLIDEWGLAREERRISMDEIRDASQRGLLSEAFGAGTAAVVAPVQSIQYRGTDIEVPDPGSDSLSKRLYDELTGIQYGEVSDRHGWTVDVT